MRIYQALIFAAALQHLVAVCPRSFMKKAIEWIKN
jgi:hypothetical protein